MHDFDPPQRSPIFDQGARVRFAPSPTGDLHLGSALVALANAAFARAVGGAFVLRIDDTDEERSDPGLVAAIVDELTWLGIGWDEGPLLQSERAQLHQQELGRLIASGQAYPCFCSDARLAELRERQRAAGKPPRYDGACSELSADDVAHRLAAGAIPAYRLRVPDRAFDFVDLVHDTVAAPPGSFGDFVIRRASGTFMYQFATVVDDIQLGITHIIRGEDHLANTARQMAVFDALGAAPPVFAHLPLLRNASGRKLAKRDPMGTLGQLRDEGYLSAVIRTYLAELLGLGAVDVLAPDVDFDLSRVRAGSAPMVDAPRLASLGREALAARPGEVAVAAIDALGLSGDAWLDLAGEIAPGCATTTELEDAIRDIAEPPSSSAVAMMLSELDDSDDATRDRDRMLSQLEQQIVKSDLADTAGAHELIASWKQISGMPAGRAMRTLRAVLTASMHGPPMPLLLATLGTEEALRRVRAAAMRHA